MSLCLISFEEEINEVCLWNHTLKGAISVIFLTCFFQWSLQ